MPETKRMKIAFMYDVIYPYVKGGVEKRVWELSRRLAVRGYEVHIFGMKFWDGDDTRIVDGVILHGICPAKKLYANGRRTVREALYYGIHLIRPLSRARPDLVDCQQFPYLPCIPARGITFLKKIPMVITWHEIWGDYWNKYLGCTGWFGKITEKLIAGFNVPTIAVSPTTASRFRSYFGRCPDSVIQNGIDISHLDSVPAAKETPDLLFVGRLIKEKNTNLLILALNLLVQDDPDLRLTIIGEGPEEAALRARIRDLNLERNVTIHSFFEDHDEVISRMKSSKVFVLPSEREGFGIVALEALACGLPVVTINHAANAITDLVTDQTGFICAPTPEALAMGIRTILPHSHEMQGACRTSAEAYDWDIIVNRLEIFYRSVIDHHV